MIIPFRSNIKYTDSCANDLINGLKYAKTIKQPYTSIQSKRTIYKSCVLLNLLLHTPDTYFGNLYLVTTNYAEVLKKKHKIFTKPK